jgi:uncharacterized protein (TIGR02145 family)
MMMRNKMKMLLIGALVSVSVQAQVIKIWKNDSATNFNMSTQVDSMSFKTDSLKLWGLGSDVSYGLNGDLDSVTFTEGVHYGSMTDSRDAKVYKTVKIGAQTWMAENLNYGTYLVETDSINQYQIEAQKFCYDNQVSNCDTGGGLYQWHTAMGFAKECGDGSKICADQISIENHQGICPGGWHVPKQSEWDLLTTRLGRSRVANKMKLFSFDGTNSSGFSALGVGYRHYNTGFYDKNNFAYFWDAEEVSGDGNSGYYHNLWRPGSGLYRNSHGKRSGYSVRCLKD